MKITSAEDMEKLQEDMNKVFMLTMLNNMTFTDYKFQLFQYEKNEELKRDIIYKTQENHQMERKEHVTDWCYVDWPFFQRVQTKCHDRQEDD